MLVSQLSLVPREAWVAEPLRNFTHPEIAQCSRILIYSDKQAILPFSIPRRADVFHAPPLPPPTPRICHKSTPVCRDPNRAVKEGRAGARGLRDPTRCVLVGAPLRIRDPMGCAAAVKGNRRHRDAISQDPRIPGAEQRPSLTPPARCPAMVPLRFILPAG